MSRFPLHSHSPATCTVAPAEMVQKAKKERHRLNARAFPKLVPHFAEKQLPVRVDANVAHFLCPSALSSHLTSGGHTKNSGSFTGQWNDMTDGKVMSFYTTLPSPIIQPGSTIAHTPVPQGGVLHHQVTVVLPPCLSH